jgi:hypothetical protein
MYSVKFASVGAGNTSALTSTLRCVLSTPTFQVIWYSGLHKPIVIQATRSTYIKISLEAASVDRFFHRT